MNDWDNDDVEDEGPQGVDLDELGGDDEPDTVPCPACGEEIYEDADRCTACGRYVVRRTGALSGRPWWWVLLGLAGGAMVLYLATC